MQVARVRWVVATAVVTATVVPLSSAITTVTIRSMPFLWFLRRIERAEGIFSQPLDVSVCVRDGKSECKHFVENPNLFCIRHERLNDEWSWKIFYFILLFIFKGHVNVDAITHSSRSTYTHTNELGKKNAKSATTRLRPFDYLLAIEWILYIAIVCVTVWCASASARVNKHKRNCEFMMDEPTSIDSCTMCTFNARHRHHRVSSHCIRLSSSSLSFRCARQYHDLT